MFSPCSYSSFLMFSVVITELEGISDNALLCDFSSSRCKSLLMNLKIPELKHIICVFNEVQTSVDGYIFPVLLSPRPRDITS